MQCEYQRILAQTFVLNLFYPVYEQNFCYQVGIDVFYFIEGDKMSKRMKLAFAGLLLALGLVFGACDAGTAAQDALQAAATQVTPSAGGTSLATGHR